MNRMQNFKLIAQRNQRMKAYTMIFVLLIVSAVQIAYAEEHHHHEASNKQEIRLDVDGKKWATDEPLRRGMNQINVLAKESMTPIHSGQATDETYKKLGRALKKQTDAIFKNCKLAPAADQELHKILVPIVKAEDTFTGSGSLGEKHEAFMAVLQSLEQYGVYFAHEKWNSPK